MSTGTPRTGLTNDPRVLAGAAAGLVSALAAIWTFRGLPLGSILFWFVPLPLFLAGLGFGLPSLLIALAAAGLALLVDSASMTPLMVYLGTFGVPAVLLLGAGLRGLTQGGGHVALGLPLTLLGLWPAAIVLLAAMLLSGLEGGLEQWLLGAVELALTRMGVEDPGTLAVQIVRLQAAALAVWLAFVLVANAAIAQRLLQRQGLGPVPAIRWHTARLPRWYPALPAVAALGWLLADPANALTPLSLCLVLTVPLLLQGLAVLHTRLRPAKARAPILVLAYTLLLVFSLPGAIILVVLGLVDQFGRRNPPPANT
ncbi:DUF2232 domain-containing protein [Roseomonas marmotae]|uniref:DUF2232 domain-containing protein n=1 Tax=Roseomonas marmotae TaxID=2768161 RepID=A0ABS3KE14_9PROT|nr:DUF2232 domain-containing protein [Roseomonas marmotae]MBO1075721.1 DUF2232 domain-containing protein [Roseomonas marmotae]QTI80451.1 DUF2232 domain-containing protein [Roseomonas marmotae]